MIVVKALHTVGARGRHFCLDILQSGSHSLLKGPERVRVLHLADLRGEAAEQGGGLLRSRLKSTFRLLITAIAESI